MQVVKPEELKVTCKHIETDNQSMKSYLITGERKKREAFISEIIEKEKIPSYSIFTFIQDIKIEEAKSIRKILSKKYSVKTLIILGNLSVIAQNSLLKSIEEISDNISIIISTDNDAEVLDTIKSRLFTIKLVDKEITEELSDNKFFGLELSDRVNFLDEYLKENSGLPPDEQAVKFIKIYREGFLKSLQTFSKEELEFHLNVLRKLLNVLKLVRGNNVNLRFALESTLL